MKRYEIASKGGESFGIYEGNTPEEAWAAMVEDAGGPGTDDDGKPLEGTPADWIIVEVE